MARLFKGSEEYFSELGDCILNSGAYKATKYISPVLTVKATRKRFGGKVDKRNRIAEILFTVGGPNYEERQFIKKARLSKMSFPIEGLVIKY